MQLQGCPRLLVVPTSCPASSDHRAWGEARRITARDSRFQGLASPPHVPVLYLAHGHPFNSSCWLPLHFYVSNKKKKGSVYVQPSPISPGGKEYKLFWQEESKRLNKQQTGSVGLELARPGALQTARTEGQPAGSASRAGSPGLWFWGENKTELDLASHTCRPNTQASFVLSVRTPSFRTSPTCLLMLWGMVMMRVERGRRLQSWLHPQIHSFYCMPFYLSLLRPTVLNHQMEIMLPTP